MAQKKTAVKRVKKEQPKTVRRPLTEEEKYERDLRKAEAIRKKRARRERLLASAAVLFAVYFGIIGIIAAYGILSFNAAPQSGKVYSVEGYLGEERMFTVSAANANNSYGLYVPFSTLTKLCPLSIAGDKDSIAIILPESGDYIKCYSASSSIKVNESPCRLSSPVLFTENDWLIPVELLGYINGLKVTYGDDRVCTILWQSSDYVLTASHSLPAGIDNITFSPLYNTDYIYGNESDMSNNVSEEQ